MPVEEPAELSVEPINVTPATLPEPKAATDGTLQAIQIVLTILFLAVINCLLILLYRYLCRKRRERIELKREQMRRFGNEMRD